MRTEAGARKWEKDRKKEGRENEDPWGEERSEWLNRVQLDVRVEGVDGKRLVRMGEKEEGDEGGRIRVDDGEARFLEQSLKRSTDSAKLHPHRCVLWISLGQVVNINCIESETRLSSLPKIY